MLDCQLCFWASSVYLHSLLQSAKFAFPLAAVSERGIPPPPLTVAKLIQEVTGFLDD